MGIEELLQEDCEQIVVKSTRRAERAHLRHYETRGAAMFRQRLRALLEIVVDSIRERDATCIVRYAEKIAEERFFSGYDLLEVQTAFNVLEETIWAVVLEELEPDEHAEALGLVSTSLGAGKDAVARAYVNLAVKAKAPSLDLSWTFQGTDGRVESW